MSRVPFVLFVPAYGRGGSGEFVRAVTLAQAVAARRPSLRIEFLLPGGPGTRQDAPFPKHCHDGPDDDKPRFDVAMIERLRPDVVIFDSGCRTSILRRCRRLGIVSVYLSDRAGTARKPFRLDWLRTLDHHWHQREHLTGAAFTIGQRLRGRLSRTRRLVFDTYFAEPPDGTGDLSPGIAGQLAAPFVLFAPGGGGYRIDGRPVGEHFLDAARQLHAATGIATLCLLGALHEGRTEAPGVMTLREVAQGRFIDLMRRAQVVVGNGGHSLNQALACGAAVVATPLGGSDQPARIERYAAAGLIRAERPEPARLAAAARALLEPAANAGQRARAAALPVVNGIPRMLDALDAMLRSRSS